MTTRELTDRAELIDLVSRQGLWLDERRFEESASIFTPDATVSTAGGQASGLAALTAQAERNHARFARTQHVTSNVLVDLAGDAATVRANLVATFVHSDTDPEPTFTVGERYHFKAIRTPAGWRFSRVEVTLVWRSGSLPERN